MTKILVLATLAFFIIGFAKLNPQLIAPACADTSCLVGP